MFSSADVDWRLMLIVKQDKWQFVVKTWRQVHSLAAARSLCWLARYLKSSVSFWISLVCSHSHIISKQRILGHVTWFLVQGTRRKQDTHLQRTTECREIQTHISLYVQALWDLSLPTEHHWQAKMLDKEDKNLILKTATKLHSKYCWEQHLIEFESFHSRLTKYSCFVGGDILSLGKWFLTFQRNVPPSSARLQGP